jgi:thymidylate kinase
MKTIDARSDMGISPQPIGEGAVPPALLLLLGEFHRQGISYCYWKSSKRLAAVLAGEGDVDLLVARVHQHHAQDILLARGFKLFPSVAWRDHPAVLSYLGYDEPTGRLVHIHLHLALVVGERLLRNYRIPWESLILANATLHPTLPIRVLDPLSEVMLLVVRANLELGRLDPMTWRGRRAAITKFELDRKALITRVDRASVRAAATQLFGGECADQVTDALYHHRPLYRWGGLKRRLIKRFAPYRTYNSIELRFRSAARALLWVAGYLNKRFVHAPRPWSRRAPGGGCVVAVVGVDGSGKSTSVATMRAWLGSEIDTLTMYFGTGDGRPSLLFRPFKMMVPLVTHVTRSKGAPRAPMSTGSPGLLYSLMLTVWALAVAMDKGKKLIAARRAAGRGLIVIADRYPQNEILGFNDGPMLARNKMVPAWLRRLEMRAYTLAQELTPDLVIKLVVKPETAMRREPEIGPAIVRERIAALQRLQFAGARIVCVDAEQSLADVMRTIRREIWRLI